MPTLLLTSRHTDDTQKLWRACIEAKWDVARVQNWKIPQVLAAETALYGEPLFVRHAAQSLGLKVLEPSVNWLPQLPEKWRQRDVQLMELSAARNVQHRAFIKPAEDKCFDARIYSSGTELPSPGPLPESLPVLVQEIVEWVVEYRCFVLNGCIMTSSVYWREGQPAKDEAGNWQTNETEQQQAISFCEQVLQDCGQQTPCAVVIDVGIIRGKGCAVIEANGACSAGTYGCDGPKILRVLKGACEPKHPA